MESDRLGPAFAENAVSARTDPEATMTITLLVVATIAALSAAIAAIALYRRVGILASGPTEERLRGPRK